MGRRVLDVIAATVAAAATLTACGGTTGGDAVAGERSQPTVSAASTSTASEPIPVPTTRSPRPTAAGPTTAEPGPDDRLLLGPKGWGPIELGMSADAAASTSVFTDAGPVDGECGYWSAVTAAPIESVVVDPELGVAGIVPRDGSPITTPEGIGIGSAAEDVAAAYPDFTIADVDTPNGALVAAPGNDGAAYRMSFTDAGAVSYLTLELLAQSCYG